MLTEQQQKQLTQDLPREVVKTRPQSGQALSYVPGDYVIKRLNEVFGFDGWSADPGAITILQGDRPVVYVPVTLRAAGVTRGDVGVGLAAKNSGDAIETALKAAFTDGLKRCARTFGASFGLALYDKEQSDVGYSFECQEILAAYDAATTADDIEAVNGRVRKAWRGLPAEEQAAITGAKKLAEQRLPRSSAATGNSPTTAAPTAHRPPALNDFYERVGEIELPGESVAVWFRHCDELPSHGQQAYEAAWLALVARTEKVGRMRDGAAWLAKSIKEEAARRDIRIAAIPTPSASSAADRAAQQPVTNDDALVSALKNALSVDHLLAVMLAHGGQTSDRVWTAAVRCAGALDGTSEEQLRADLAGRQSVAKPSEWATVAAFLGDVLKAVEIGGVDGAVTRHNVAIKALPEKLQRLSTSTAIFHRMTLRIGAANDAATLKQVHTNLEAFVKGGKLGRAQAEVITTLLNDRATKLDAMAAQNSAAA